jgi:phage-related protein
VNNKNMEVVYFNAEVKLFVSSLSTDAGSKTVRMIELLSQYEYRLGMPHSRMVETGLYELRIRGKQEIRLFYTFYQQKIIMLLGYIKKTQKIPQPVLKLAKDRFSRLT